MSTAKTNIPVKLCKDCKRHYGDSLPDTTAIAYSIVDVPKLKYCVFHSMLWRISNSYALFPPKNVILDVMRQAHETVVETFIASGTFAFITVSMDRLFENLADRFAGRQTKSVVTEYKAGIVEDPTKTSTSKDKYPIAATVTLMGFEYTDRTGALLVGLYRLCSIVDISDNSYTTEMEHMGLSTKSDWKNAISAREENPPTQEPAPDARSIQRAEKPMRRCSVCQVEKKTMPSCWICRGDTHYCSTAHRVADRQRHRTECIEERRKRCPLPEPKPILDTGSDSD